MCNLKFFLCFSVVNLAIIGFGESETDFDQRSFLLPHSKPKTKTLIIDTDAGCDDAVAILNLLGQEELFEDIRVQSITTVNGNTNVDNVAINVLKILKTANRLDIPVYNGARQSILKTPKTDDYYGKDGFGDFYFPDPPSPDLIQQPHAVNALIEQATLYPGELTLVCLGPLTNIALATRLDKKFLSKLKEIYILGGSDSGIGNMQPGVEFNFYVDPEAAAIVLKEAEKANKVLNLLPWETASHRSEISMEWRKNVLGTLGSRQVDLINKAENRTLRGAKWISSDALLSAIVIDSQVLKSAEVYHGDVEVCGSISRAALFVDYGHSTNLTGNIRILKEINEDRYKEILLRNFNPSEGLKQRFKAVKQLLWENKNV